MENFGRIRVFESILPSLVISGRGESSLSRKESAPTPLFLHTDSLNHKIFIISGNIIVILHFSGELVDVRWLHIRSNCRACRSSVQVQPATDWASSAQIYVRITPRAMGNCCFTDSSEDTNPFSREPFDWSVTDQRRIRTRPVPAVSSISKSYGISTV